MRVDGMRGERGGGFRAPAAIFWVGFALRVAVILAGHTYRIRPDDAHFDFGFEAGRIARSLVTGHGYGNPFNGYSGPTAWLPPLYPLLVALGFKLFGVYSEAAAIFILGMNSVFSALIGPAVYEIAARCLDVYGMARRRSRKAAPVALWSAWIWAACPAFWQYAVHWVWEMSLSACLFTWAMVLALRLRGVGEGAAFAEVSAADGGAKNGAPTPGVGVWIWFGVVWGLVALSNASLLLMFAGSVGWVVWPALRGLWVTYADEVRRKTHVSEARRGAPGRGWRETERRDEVRAKTQVSEARPGAPGRGWWVTERRDEARPKTQVSEARPGAPTHPSALRMDGAPATHPSALRMDGGPGMRRLMGGVLVACVAFGAVLTPWVVRNERAFGAFVPTRGNFGIEFWHSTEFGYYGPLPWGGAMPMSWHAPEFQRYVREGELRYAHEKGELAMRNIRARPQMFVWNTLQRVQFFWGCTPHPPEGHPVQEYLRVLLYAAISVAGLLGLGLMFRRRVPGAGLFGLACLLVPLAYYVVTVQPRFRHPLEPLLTICGVYLFRSTEAGDRGLHP